MTEEEYLRMKNILNTIVEQQTVFEENHRKADARMAATDNRMSTNAEGIAALLIIAQMYEQEIAKTNEQKNKGFDRVNARFEQVAATFQELARKTAETDERIDALVNMAERYISKNVVKEVEPKANRNVTARLSPRLVRIVFERSGKKLWISPT